MPWFINYERALPAAPGRIAIDATPRARPMRSALSEDLTGCWHLRFEPRFSGDVERLYRQTAFYEGTLRFSAEGESRVSGSGDLYLHHAAEGSTVPAFKPRRNDEVPVFPLVDYRYYLVLESLKLSKTKGLEMTLRSHRLSPGSGGWSDEGLLTARLSRPGKSAEAEAPAAFEGPLNNERDGEIGMLKMARVSPYLRSAVVEVDRVPLVGRLPTAAGRTTLRSIFEKVGWNLQVLENGREPVAEPDGAAWSQQQLHAQLISKRGPSRERQDSRWRYNLLCVRLLGRSIFQRYGLMYDAQAIDSNHVPREGAAVAAKARFPVEDRFESAAGAVLSSVPRAYLWTAAHELGHAMGLAHNFRGLGIMQGLHLIADTLRERRKTFPDDILLEFDEHDAHRLRHAPDIWVRPGGTPFLAGFAFEPIPEEDLVVEARDLELEVRPYESSLPFGAPLRLRLTLTNTSPGRSVVAPRSLSLKSGYVSGRVIPPGGAARSFSTAVRYNGEGTGELGPRGQLVHSMTLLRGGAGALLESPGVYRIEVTVTWDVRGGGSLRVGAASSVVVLPPESPAHGLVALEIHSNPEVMLAVIFRSDAHPADQPELRAAAGSGIRAIRGALDEPALRPHFAVLEAKRVGSLPGRLEEAVTLIDEATVMTGTEAGRLAELLEPAFLARAVSPAIERAAAACVRRVANLRPDHEGRQRVARLLELHPGLAPVGRRG